MIIGKEIYFAPVRKVNTSDPAVRVYLYARGLDVISPVRSSREVRQIKLNLIPASGQTDRHRCAEGSNSSGALKITHSESSVHVPVVQYLFKRR